MSNTGRIYLQYLDFNAFEYFKQQPLAISQEFDIIQVTGAVLPHPRGRNRFGGTAPTQRVTPKVLSFLFCDNRLYILNIPNMKIRYLSTHFLKSYRKCITIVPYYRCP